ncbi:MAG: SDR family NAD(P)-dependent oxidoreductase [Deltaproteobacteria bacterium]|nr:SDR family NAD(P)-dependent oxidoreductase [Deltaproteobacteria bacterium]
MSDLRDFAKRLASLDRDKLALLALKMKEQLDARDRATPIAIVGMGLRLPGGVDGPTRFWRRLEEGFDAITEVPADRFPLSAWYDPDPDAPGKMATRWGGFLDAVDRFDARYFGISPREARAMDPQQRILLELSIEALLDASLALDRIPRARTAVFVGVSTHDWSHLIESGLPAEDLDAYVGTGIAPSVVAGRISFALGLSGPCLMVDTACSTSLVAVHLAAESLTRGECDLALAGGASVILDPKGTVFFSKLKAMSRDGRSKAFDASADGYVRSEGAGVLVLKRLDDAIRDRDPIWAVVRGTAINHDGPASGLTVPSADAQEAVIRAALARAAVDPADVGYIEAHGTGTPLGDPIEIRALGRVFGARPSERPLFIGSVKSNLGHAEAAAGVAGLAKAALMVHHGAIPPHLHFRAPSPRIPWAELPLQVPTARRPWPEHTPRIAGVSSFGFSGTNAHVIVEAGPPMPPRTGAEANPQLVVLSGRSRSQVEATTAAWAHAIAGATDLRLEDVAATALLGRPKEEWRAAVVAPERGALVDALRAQPARGTVRRSLGVDARLGLTFVFGGQGGQWLGMGRGLLRAYPAFRESLAHVDRAIRAEADWSALGALESEHAPASIARIQPLIFAIQVALARLYAELGVVPETVVGHSMGEAAAAVVAGALTLEDGVSVIIRRSALLERLSGQGAMAQVGLRAQELEPLLSAGASVAAENGPETTVISGQVEAIEASLRALEARGVEVRRIKVDVASHSAIVEPVLAQLADALAHLRPQSPAIRMISTVHGDPVQGGELSASYWTRNLRAPVRFAPVIAALARSGQRLFLELGPHPVLISPLLDILAAERIEGAALPSLVREADEPVSLLESLGALFAAGLPLDETRLLSKDARRVRLPPHPWERDRHRLPLGDGQGQEAPSTDPLHGRRIASPIAAAQFASVISDRRPKTLAEHRVFGSVVLPAAAQVVMAASAAYEIIGRWPLMLEDLSFERPVVVPAGETRRLLLVLEPTAEGHTVKLAEDRGGRFSIASTGRVGTPKFGIPEAGTPEAGTPEAGAPEAGAPEAGTPEASTPKVGISKAGVPKVGIPKAAVGRSTQRPPIGPADPTSTARADAYRESLADRGYDLGPSFSRIEALEEAAEALLGRIAPAEPRDQALGCIAPGVLDSCFQVLGAAVSRTAELGPDQVFVPAAIERVTIHREVKGERLLASVLTARDAGDTVIGDLRVTLESGELAIEIAGLAARRTSRQQLQGWLTQAARPEAFEVAWRRADGPDSAPPPGRRLVLVGSPSIARSALATALEASAHRVTAISFDEVESSPRLDAILASSAPNAAIVLGLGSDGRRALENAPAVVQALTRMSTSPATLTLVTRGAQSVVGHQDVIEPLSGSLFGFFRSLRNEHPELSPRIIDLDPAEAPEAGVLRLPARIFSASDEDQIAIRGAQPWVPRLVRSSALTGGPVPISPDKSVIITGGLGGLGLLVAERLVERGARKIVLVGRTRRPEAEPVLQRLQGGGAAVKVVLADVRDPIALDGAVRAARDLGPIGGVVHAVGLLADATILGMDRARIDAVVAPKLDGAAQLATLVAGDALDFFILFSSIAGVVGGPGQANYAAANAGLDALACALSARGLPATSIAWASFSDVGLAAREEVRGARLQKQGIGSMTPADGLENLGRVRPSRGAFLAIMPFEPRTLGESYQGLLSWPFLSELVFRDHAPRPRHDGLRQALAATAGDARTALLKKFLIDEVSAVSHLESSHVDPTAPFGSLGFDSLMMVELRNRIELALSVRISAASLFSHPTLDRLLPFLESQLASEPHETEVARPPRTEPDRAEAQREEKRKQIDALSEAEAEARLAERLSAIERRKR